MQKESVIRKNKKIVARKTGDEYILVPITDNVANMEAVYTMNETAAFIWDCIDGERSAEQIADIMTGEYDIDKPEALSDVMELLNDLEKHNIVSG